MSSERSDAPDRAATPPPGRYSAGRDGSSAATGRLVAVLIGLLAVGLVVALVVFVVRRNSTEEISGQQSGFTVVDERTLEMTVDVTRSEPATRVFCIIRAKDSAGAEVGRREVLVEPGTEKTTRLVTRVVTTGPLVAGDVYGCGDDVPDYLTTPATN